jgi:hypothetical protein
VEDIAGQIEREVSSWEGVSVRPHRFGGVEFLLGRRELGHLHRDGWADFPFTARIREMLVETGRVTPHKFGVDGWVSRDLDDAGEVVEIFRLSYERAQVAQAVRASRAAHELGEAPGSDVPARDHDPDTTA